MAHSSDNLQKQPLSFKDPTLLKALQGHKDRVTKAIFHPSLKQVISSSDDGLILAWGLRPNARPNKFAGHKGPVTDVAVNGRGDLIASCSRDNTVRIWSNNASAACTIMKGHSAPVKSI
jgi:WD40 repeat protein